MPQRGQDSYPLLLKWKTNPVRASLIPNISLIKLDTMFIEELTKFILEGNRFVMLLLLIDVVADYSELGFTDGEDSISSLPSFPPYALVVQPMS